MNPRNREYFDQQVEWVLARLPQDVLHILQEVPLYVEDQPSRRLMQTLDIGDARKLCGYFSGTPHGKTSRYFGSNVYHPAEIPVPKSVTLFRRGIVAAVRDEAGRVRRNGLRQQIRTTVLRELARLHGMKEGGIADTRYG